MNDDAPVSRLIRIMRALRDPQTGCPWDREQTMASIVPHTLEEAYEVAEAVDEQNPNALRDELGDLLFQVVFLAALADEAGWFNFNDVATSIAEKLERRHPHVFGSNTILTAEAQTESWESLKAAERAKGGASGALAGVAKALPALTRASKLGKRAGRIGFDWPTAEGVRSKVSEELGELDEAVSLGESRERQQEELGDVLFALANWARRLGLDPEAALRAGNQKFESRFARMEGLAEAERRPLDRLTLEEWEALWVRAKAIEKAG
ncbi:MAG: nucleoside triphosphate pyrophosphohydrolase [Steroidobacteraceae bacterium]